MATGDLRIETRQRVLYVLIDRLAKRNALSRSILEQPLSPRSGPDRPVRGTGLKSWGPMK